MSLDLMAARAQFPVVQRQDYVFLDNASGSQTLGAVADSIRDYLVTNNAQLGASYSVSKVCSDLFAEAHEVAARFIHARSDEVVFGASATQLLRNLSLTLRFRPGDEIVVSTLDHEANITPWLDMAHRQDLQVRWWHPQNRSNSPELLAADLERLLSPRTKLVACTHASHILGTVTDVKAVADAAHSHGAFVCVDGVAYVSHRPVDVQALGVDMYVFSWHKVFGPHLATMYTSWAAQTHMGSLGPFFRPSTTLENKVGISAASYELCHSITRVVSYLRKLGDNPWDAISGHEQEMQEELLSFLKSRPRVTIYGTTESAKSRRLPIVSFTVQGWDSKNLVEAIVEKTNYCIRWGSFYSQRLVRDILNLDEDGVVRVSMVHYNTN